MGGAPGPLRMSRSPHIFSKIKGPEIGSFEKLGPLNIMSGGDTMWAQKKLGVQNNFVSLCVSDVNTVTKDSKFLLQIYCYYLRENSMVETVRNYQRGAHLTWT